MDTSGFNSHARQHLGFYGGFVKFMFASATAIAVVLILMAVFLL